MSTNLNPITSTRTLEMLRSALGPVIGAALDDKNVIEIMVNPDGKLWLDRHGEGRVYTGEIITPPDAERIVKLVASHIRQEVTINRPIVSAELPGGGERFEGLLPPVVSAPCFSIRKGAAKIFTLVDYMEAGTMTKAQAEALSYAVNAKLNILIVGGTSSGKTTLANALLAEIANCNDRVLILEDTRELQCGAEDTVALRTHYSSGGQDVKLADLVRSTLRLRPDRIVVGEVRGPEALDMLKAWNTGHPGGIATVHANSAEAGLYRIEQLILEGANSVPRALIAETINVIVFISGRGKARRVQTIARVLGVHGHGESGEYDLEPLVPNFTPLKLVPKSKVSPSTQTPTSI